MQSLTQHLLRTTRKTMRPATRALLGVALGCAASLSAPAYAEDEAGSGAREADGAAHDAAQDTAPKNATEDSPASNQAPAETSGEVAPADATTDSSSDGAQTPAPDVTQSDPEAETSAPLFTEETSSANMLEEPQFEAETQRMTWPNVPLLSTGATVFGVSYLPAVVGGALTDAEGRKDLYIPVAGPWMMFSKDPEESKGDKALLVADGVAQGVGALMLLTSFFIPEKTTRHWYLIGESDTRLAPTRIGSGYGMGASGRF